MTPDDNDDLVVGDLMERKEDTWVGQERKQFDVSEMVIESDRKVTFKFDTELLSRARSIPSAALSMPWRG